MKNENDIKMIFIIFAIVVLCISFVIVSNKYNNSVFIKEFETQITNNLQTISAGISYEQRRRRQHLFIRDIILQENSSISLKEAFEIADLNIQFSEKYKRIDPLFLTAIQKIESNFNTKSVSSQNAIGINQIIPSTGRLLCRILGWEYSIDILYEMEKNIYLSVVYLDILYVQHENNLELVLAEYNGGHRAVNLYKNDIKRLNSETKQYVPKVLDFYNMINEKFELYSVELNL